MRVLDPLADPDWDERLPEHEGASIFHSAAWARVLAKTYRYSCCYLEETVNDKLVFLLPLMDVRSLLTGKRGVSLPFTDFCEPLQTEGASAPEAMSAVIDLGRQRGWRHVETRGGGRLFGDSRPAMTVLSHVLDLGKSEDALFAAIKESTRRNIRKAKREGVEVELGASPGMLEEFYRLNCLTRREHGLPPQPLAYFRNLQRHLIGEGHGCVALARWRGRSVGGAVYLHFGREALYKHGASERRHLHLRPNDLAMWEAIRWYRDRGFQRLSFGRTELQHEGLRRYKLAWGAAEQVRPYYRYNLKSGSFETARLKGPGPATAVFRRLPIPVSRAIGAALYRHVA